MHESTGPGSEGLHPPPKGSGRWVSFDVFGFELGESALKVRDTNARALEHALLSFEVFARHQVEVIEEGHKQRADIFFDVTGR